jgi:hypothetical protein
MAPKHWDLSEIDWSRLSPEHVTPRLVWIVRATCLVESRADLYTGYLEDVVGSTSAAAEQIRNWGAEEAQHGRALREWLARADPAFRFDQKDSEYRSGVAYYRHTGRSVRGSLQNELLCRCVVESLASAYYRAIRDSTAEPVLRDICERLSRDEAKHFKLFSTLLANERRRGRNGLLADLRVVHRRIRDLENDQIAYAFFCSGERPDTYSTRAAALAFLPRLYDLYRAPHIEYALRLTFQALEWRVPLPVVKAGAHLGVAYARIRSTWMRMARGPSTRSATAAADGDPRWHDAT